MTRTYVYVGRLGFHAKETYTCVYAAAAAAAAHPDLHEFVQDV